MTTPRPPLPSEAEILAGLREAITAVLDQADLAHVDVDAIGSDTALLSLPLDSLRLVEATSRIEDRFRVFIPEQQAFAFVTVGDVVDYVRERAADKAARAAERGAA